MGHASILLYLCQKCYQGIIGNPKKGYFTHSSQNCLNYPGR